MDQRVKRGVLSALFMSVLMPFSGLLYVHKPIRAFVCALICLGLIAGNAVFVFFDSFAGMAASVGVLAVVWLYSIIVSMLAARKGLDEEVARQDIGPWIVGWALILFWATAMVPPMPYQAYSVVRSSMAPMLEPGDYVIGKRASTASAWKEADLQGIHPGEIVVIQDQQGTHYFRQVAGVPGDVLEIKDGQLLRNGEPTGNAAPMTLPGDMVTLVVPEHAFVLISDTLEPSAATLNASEEITAKICYIYWSSNVSRLGDVRNNFVD